MDPIWATSRKPSQQRQPAEQKDAVAKGILENWKGKCSKCGTDIYIYIINIYISKYIYISIERYPVLYRDPGIMK
jgi:hypothetical protein